MIDARMEVKPNHILSSIKNKQQKKKKKKKKKKNKKKGILRYTFEESEIVCTVTKLEIQGDIPFSQPVSQALAGAPASSGVQKERSVAR